MNWDTFERYSQRGKDARNAGQFESAAVYYAEAARAMLALSKQAQTEELREARLKACKQLTELARDCEDAAKTGRKLTPRAGGGGGGGRGTQQEQSGEGDGAQHDWIVKEKPSIRFSDVAGLEDVKEEIRLKMIYPFEHADLAQKFGIRAGGGILLYGPPGTGKTMLAKATAGELDATFFRISPADVLSKWVGEAEQNIKKLFDQAMGEQRSVVFIDEIEALIPARRDEGSSVMQRVVPQILQGMEGFDKKSKSQVLFLGATNVPWQLDPAVLRPGRFDEKIYIPLPDYPARVRLLELYLGKRPIDDSIDFNQIAHTLEGYSGADIKYMCDRAALLPFLRAVAGKGERLIDKEIVVQVIAETPKSVTPAMTKRFDEWAAAL